MGSKRTAEQKKDRKPADVKSSGFETSTSTGKGEKSYAESITPKAKADPAPEKGSAPAKPAASGSNSSYANQQ